MASAKNHARRSRRGYRMQKSITGGSAKKTWIKLAEKRRAAERVSIFRKLWRALAGRNPAGMSKTVRREDAEK